MKSTLFLISFTLLVAGCTSTSDLKNTKETIEIYKSTPLASWNIFLENYETQQMFSGDKTSLPKNDVMVQVSGKNSKNDALTFSWQDTWRAGLTFEKGVPLDLTSYMDQGVMSLDIKINELPKGGVSFKMECQEKSCDRRVAYTLKARELVGKGWQHVYVPLKCFKQDQDSFNAVTMPFALEVGGKGDVSIANIELLSHAPANVSLHACPDYKAQSIKPDMLNEWWSIEWWLPRHQQKLLDAKAILDTGKPIDIVFIGDSITHGWEKEGAKIWEKQYAPRNSFNLGFSGDRTENVLWRLEHDAVKGMNPKLAVLMIGTNNAGHRSEDPNTTAAGIKKILDELQQRLPNTKILLLAIFPRDEQPDSELRVINEQVNSIIKGYADNKRVYFANINPVFLTSEGVLTKEVMPDLLHPHTHGYQLWANAMEPYLQKLLK